MDGITDGERLVIRLDLVVLPMEVVSRANHKLLESRVVDSIQVVVLGLVDLIGDYVFVDGHRRSVSRKYEASQASFRIKMDIFGESE